MDPVLMKIAEICFGPEDENDEVRNRIFQVLDTLGQEKNRFSLKVLSLKEEFAEALKDKIIVEKVEKIFENEKPLLENHHFIDSLPHLFYKSVVENYSKSGINFSIIIRNSKYQLCVNKKPIGEFPGGQCFDWLDKYVKFFIELEHKSFIFVASESDSKTSNETPQQNIERIVKTLGEMADPESRVCDFNCYQAKTFNIGTQCIAIMDKQCGGSCEWTREWKRQGKY